MAERLLLVTGSRALADTPAAKQWARGKLSAVLDYWEPTLLVHGGCANSPDAWAGALASCRAHVYYADGRLVEIDRNRVATLLGAWAIDNERPHPLLRNERMVRAVAAATDKLGVYALALTAPWAKTHGTEHTVARAREAGLVVEVRACPAELGPREASRADR